MAATCDIAIIGAGAAGLAAAIFAGEASGGRYRIVLLDGVQKPGAKILVSGGGRCNITNEQVTPEDFWGGPRPLVRSVLRAFSEKDTLSWMQQLGVPTKLEPAGKIFPISDSARSVVDALLKRVEDVGVRLNTSWRVDSVRRGQSGAFVLHREGTDETLEARRLIVATGGLALPKSGSDGAGLKWMEALGHTIIATTPGLAPLVLQQSREPGGRFAELSGVSIDVRIAVASVERKKLFEWTGPLLFTHFGLSGPAPMNASRHIARYVQETGGSRPVVTLSHPRFRDLQEADVWLQDEIRKSPRASVARLLTNLYPERLSELLASGMTTLGALSRKHRQELARRLSALEVHVLGDRGYAFAEVTAGGVDLPEVDVRTMQSRVVPGLYLCGEILDIDGRIGGFNFQWAWSTGFLAGRGAVAQLSLS